MIKEKMTNGIARAKRGFCNIKTKADSAIIAAATAAGTTAMTNVGSCDGAAALTTALSYLAIPVGLLGGVFLIMGIIHYAGANSDGDGPAKKKATNEIAGGGMVIAVAVVLKPMVGAILGAIGVA